MKSNRLLLGIVLAACRGRLPPEGHRDPPSERPPRGAARGSRPQGRRPRRRGARPRGRPRQGGRPPRAAGPRRNGRRGGPRPRGRRARPQAQYQDLAEGSRRPEILAAEADVADKRAQLELARRELERQRALLDEKIGTQQRLRRREDRASTAPRPALKASEERLQAHASRASASSRPSRPATTSGRAKSVLHAVRDRGARGRDPGAGRRRRPAPDRRAGPAARGRPARPHAGVRRPPLRAHVHPRAGARQGAARNGRDRQRGRVSGQDVPGEGHRDLARRRVHAQARRDAERARQPRLRGQGRPRPRAGRSRSSRDSPPTSRSPRTGQRAP